jgi:hypothetical protein
VEPLDQITLDVVDAVLEARGVPVPGPLADGLPPLREVDGDEEGDACGDVPTVLVDVWLADAERVPVAVALAFALGTAAPDAELLRVQLALREAAGVPLAPAVALLLAAALPVAVPSPLALGEAEGEREGSGEKEVDGEKEAMALSKGAPDTECEGLSEPLTLKERPTLRVADPVRKEVPLAKNDGVTPSTNDSVDRKKIAICEGPMRAP